MKDCYFNQHIWLQPIKGAPCLCGKLLWGVEMKPKETSTLEMDWESLKRQSMALIRRKSFKVIRGGKETK